MLLLKHQASNSELSSQNKELNKKFSDLEESVEKATKEAKATLVYILSYLLIVLGF